MFKKYAFNFYRKGVDKLNIDYFKAFKDKIDTTNLKFQNIKIHYNKIFINTTLGIFEVNSNCKILNFQPILTDEFEIVSDDEIIYYRPYAFTSTIKNLYGSKPIVKIYDLTDKDTPRDVVGSLKMKTQLYVISRTSGLYKFKNEQFTSFKENNIWNEKELQFIKKFKKNKIVISNSIGDVYIINDDPKFKIEHKISSNEIIGNSISFLETYKDYIVIGTERGINF